MPFDFKETVENLLQYPEQFSDLTVFGAMLSGSLLEYVFPPIPGDIWTVGGSILIARGKKFLTVFLGVTLGSAMGFLIDYGFGIWLSNPDRRFRHWGPRWERLGRGIDRIAQGFERHTAFYLVVNRFLPGIRALFFVAAGFARVKIWKVLTFGLIGAIIWNLLLIGLGYLLGYNLERLLVWLTRYTWAAFIILAAVILVVFLRFYRNRRRTGIPYEE